MIVLCQTLFSGKLKWFGCDKNNPVLSRDRGDHYFIPGSPRPQTAAQLAELGEAILDALADTVYSDELCRAALKLMEQQSSYDGRHRIVTALAAGAGCKTAA